MCENEMLCCLVDLVKIGHVVLEAAIRKSIHDWDCRFLLDINIDSDTRYVVVEDLGNIA